MRPWHCMLLGVMLLACVTSITGCRDQPGSEPVAEPASGSSSQQNPEMPAAVPTVDLEATVVSISFGSTDTGRIRIERIISTDNPYNWELKGVQGGSTIQVQFLYSARPAIIRRLPQRSREGADPDSETTVSGTTFSTESITVEDGYLVFEFEGSPGSEVIETTLPGLEAATKFRAVVSYSSPTRISIGEYKTLP